MIDQQKLFEELFSLADSIGKSGLQLSACADKLSDTGDPICQYHASEIKEAAQDLMKRFHFLRGKYYMLKQQTQGREQLNYDSKHLSSNNSRRDQLLDLAQSSDEDVSELAWGDLFKEFGTGEWKGPFGRAWSGVNSSPAIGDGGTVYVGSDDGKLYAIKTDSKGLAKSPWPMRGQNARHTGRVMKK
jgi:hypothetical protein